MKWQSEEPVESERLTNRMIPEDKLREMLDKGYISWEAFESALEESREAYQRKDAVDGLIADGSYPLERTDSDIEEDHRRRLIDDGFYNMCIWYRSNRPKDVPMGDEKSFKLKLSTAGLRIMGRYDLCEYSMKRDSTELSKRLYCFTGTLFEGCGNVKAPDDAICSELSEKRRDYAFRFLSELKAMGLLGGNYRDSPFSSVFFDLYTRYDDSPMIHTKGTAEYPYFIKMLMFIIGADDI